MRSPPPFPIHLTLAVLRVLLALAGPALAVGAAVLVGRAGHARPLAWAAAAVVLVAAAVAATALGLAVVASAVEYRRDVRGTTYPLFAGAAAALMAAAWCVVRIGGGWGGRATWLAAGVAACLLAVWTLESLGGAWQAARDVAYVARHRG